MSVEHHPHQRRARPARATDEDGAACCSTLFMSRFMSRTLETFAIEIVVNPNR